MHEITLDPEIKVIAHAIVEVGGKAILVGGTVRDYFLSLPMSKDLDIEVYHLSPAKLETVLAKFGQVSAVGKAFGVFKLFTAKNEIDFSLPRSESKTGKGHKGFIVNSDPHMSFDKAASRRDFTVNALGYDILTKRLFDPFDGLRDIKRGILRQVGPSFAEDPLRVLRAMQFSARFEFKIDPETIHTCQKIDLSELPQERLFEEYKKLLLIAKRPSIGLKAARDLGVLNFFPELKALIDVPQDPKWHPEGDVWIHTLMVVDEAAKLRQNDEKADISFMFGALCHDFGKPLTTVFNEGHWRSPSHDTKGLEPTESFLKRLTRERKLIDQIKVYVKEHLKPALLYQVRAQVTDSAIRRLAVRISIPDLIRLAKADHFGRTTPDAIAREFPAGKWLAKRSEALNVKQHAPRPILMGRHLLKLGIKPGPLVGQLIQESFELQLDGKLNHLEETLAWAEERLKKLAS